MELYDAIVIGAGNGGLVSALRLQKSGKNVLLLERTNTPGGFATSFIRGRFEFEGSLHELCDYGTEENQGNVYKLFEDLEIQNKIEFINVKEAYHVYSSDTKEEYVMPFGIKEYIDKMEEYVPKSRESMEKFFELTLECKEALAYLEETKGKPDTEILMNKYQNFMKVAANPLNKVLKSLKMPKKAQEILTTYWTYLGSPASTLSFVHFSSMLYSYITLKAQIPRKRSHEISLTLATKFESLGGKINYLSEVEEILFEENKISGVKLKNGKTYFTKHIIANISPNIVFGKMIPKNLLPEDAKRLTNSRVLGARGFQIYLGLNQSASDIGLNNYSYFIYHSLNSDKEYMNMSNINNDSSVSVVIQNGIEKGTCILEMTSLFFGDIFSKNVNRDNYFDLKDKIAEQIIDNFEKTTGIMIKQYIEEIEIATPLTFARFTGHSDGVIYGYKLTGLDNIMPRIMNSENEVYIQNLRFCGGFGERASGYSSSYLSGNNAALRTLKDMKGED